MNNIIYLNENYRVLQNQIGTFLQKKGRAKTPSSNKGKISWKTRGNFSSIEEAIKGIEILERYGYIPDMKASVRSNVGLLDPIQKEIVGDEEDVEGPCTVSEVRIE